MAAEAEARNKKRKAEGKLPLEEDVRKAASIEAPKEGTSVVEDEANKRRKLLQEALEMDKDDEGDSEQEKNDDGDGRYALQVVR